jgi:hypothetical protein
MSWDQFSADLRKFAEQLYQEQTTQPTANGLFAVFGHLERTWGVKREMSVTEGIPLPCPRKKGLHPQNSDVVEAEIRFAFELGEDWEAAHLPHRADFQVKVLGKLALENCVIDLEDHWRVDSHTFPADPPPHEPHPYFHFQRGGHAQDQFAAQERFVPGRDLDSAGASDWKGLLQSPGPRVPFAPHCPILAIDFSIGQHDGMVWRRLRGTPEYRNIIGRAQERLWTPFFAGLADIAVRARWMGPVFVS